MDHTGCYTWQIVMRYGTFRILDAWRFSACNLVGPDLESLTPPPPTHTHTHRGIAGFQVWLANKVAEPCFVSQISTIQLYLYHLLWNSPFCKFLSQCKKLIAMGDWLASSKDPAHIWGLRQRRPRGASTGIFNLYPGDFIIYRIII